MEVRKIMTKNPACCTPDSTLQEVAHMMEMYDCGCIPVVEDHRNNKPVGTVTDRDIAIRTVATDQNPLDMKASDIMTTDIATITPETSIEECRNVMEDKQIRRILVVDKNGKCIGIVAQADVVQGDDNSHQTAEFIREISEPASSQYGDMSSAQNQFGMRDTGAYGSQYDSQYGGMSSERGSYQNFSNQNRSYEQDFSRGEDSYNQSFSREENRLNRPFSRKGRKFKKSYQKEKSFFSLGTLLPLFIAVGAGAALKYFLPVDEKSQTSFVPRSRVTSSIDKTADTTPKVSIELPTETNIKMKDSRDIKTGGIASSNLETDTDTTNEIGRTARL
ncbi:MAG: CBS domain-containing protein [Acidobacteriota bacterium]|nr:CBS domain-containing protein [Acidobacteriota bacterium]